MDSPPRIYDTKLGDANRMIRRSQDALYFTEELIQKIAEKRPIKLWDCVNMFFPRETNRKQFDCALVFLQALEKNGSLQNTEVMTLYDSQNERYTLTGHVVPKLRKFGVIESNGRVCSKRYSYRFGKDFSQLLRDLGLELFGYYARHYNDVKQLEGNSH